LRSALFAAIRRTCENTFFFFGLASDLFASSKPQQLRFVQLLVLKKAGECVAPCAPDASAKDTRKFFNNWHATSLHCAHRIRTGAALKVRN